jgi:hypothetical protein
MAKILLNAVFVVRMALLVLLTGFLTQGRAIANPIVHTPQVNACVGDTVTIPISILNGSQLGSISLRLLFDQQKLGFVSASLVNSF